LETKPSFPPKTAALKALPPTERCLFSKRAKFELETLVVEFKMFFNIVTCAVSDIDCAELYFFLAPITEFEMLFFFFF